MVKTVDLLAGFLAVCGFESYYEQDFFVKFTCYMFFAVGLAAFKRNKT